jgi:D-alanyl-D-alanine carboxypeptidase
MHGKASGVFGFWELNGCPSELFQGRLRRIEYGHPERRMGLSATRVQALTLTGLVGLFAVALFAAVGLTDAWEASPTPTSEATVTPIPSPTPQATTFLPTPEATLTPTPAPEPTALPDGAGSSGPPVGSNPNIGLGGLLAPVDEQNPLAANYVAPGLVAIPGEHTVPESGSHILRADALEALQRMLRHAASQGHDIRVRSAYRSHAEQEATFRYWVSVLGLEEASRVSATAGHSEHQLGSTVDLTTGEVRFDLAEALGAIAAGRWLTAHGHEYGFVLSYPQGAEIITGYAYEPWHFRYIGADQAAAQNASGLTLNHYLQSLQNGVDISECSDLCEPGRGGAIAPDKNTPAGRHDLPMPRR